MPFPSASHALRRGLATGAALGALGLSPAAHAQEEPAPLENAQEEPASANDPQKEPAEDAQPAEVEYAQPAEVEYAGPAEYAEAAPAAAYTGGYPGDEITVTATKREQLLQDVPVAVSVVSGATIERAEIRDLRDLSSLVPSLRAMQSQSSANTDFIIRGFGNGANHPGIEPSVGVFVDGVYRSRPAAQVSDLPGVSRIEVLRGPQSTLFGKNASAGVISIVTAEPRFTFGGSAELSYGNHDALIGKALVTGPISETAAVSLAAGFNKRDGFVRDLGTGGRSNDRDRWFVRGQALYEPSALLKLRLIADYGRIDETCCAAVNLRSAPSTAAIEAIGGRVSDPARPFADVSYSNFASTNAIENYGLSGEIDFGFGPFGLMSITAWRRTDAVTDQDSDFTSADLLARDHQDQAISTFTQELRATAALGGNIDLLLGAFYLNEDVEQAGEVVLGEQFRSYADLLVQQASNGSFSVAGLEESFAALAGAPGRFDGRFFLPGQGLSEFHTLESEAISIFGQVDFSPVERLTLTAGLNYTHDSKRFSTDVASTNVFSGLDLRAFRGAAADAATASILDLAALQFLDLPNAVEDGRTKDDDVSVTLRAAYEVTDSLNAYVTHATGFKPSSVNLSRGSRPAAADAAAIGRAGLGLPNLRSGGRVAGAEKSHLYEFGLKGNFGPASFDFAAFRQTVEDFQSNIFTGSGFFLANGGKRSVLGFEFDGVVRPVEPLMLRLAVTYLDAEYDSFEQSAFGDLSGSTPASIPPLSFTFGGVYDHELGSGDHLILGGDYRFEAEVPIVDGLRGFVVRDPATGALLSQGGIEAARAYRRQVDDFNASLTYAMQSGLELTVWGRNLLDDRNLLSIFDTPAQPLSISAYPNQPRTYGMTARYRF